MTIFQFFGNYCLIFSNTKIWVKKSKIVNKFRVKNRAKKIVLKKIKKYHKNCVLTKLLKRIKKNRVKNSKIG